MKFRFGNFLKSYSKGFTLVELLIYSMIFTVAAGLLTGVLIAISGIQTRENAAFEVTRQLQFVTQRIQYAIRDASVVEGVYEGDTEGTTCTAYCSIKLRTEDPTLDPTVISSDIGGVYIQEGTGPKVALTTANSRITSLLFTKVGNPGGLSTVTVDLTMVFNPDDPQLRVEKNLASAIAHVSAATFDSDLLPDTTEARNIGGSSLKWNNLILSGGITITGPDSIGEQAGVSMARGLNHGSSNISQYYVTSTPYDKYGQRYDIGGTPMLYLEGDIGQSSRRAYFMNGNLGVGTTNPTSPLYIYNNIAYTSYADGEYSAIFRTNSYTGIKVLAQGAGYSPASVILEATSSGARGQGIYYFNPTASTLWFSGTTYNSSNDRYIIGYKSSATFNGDVAQNTNALVTVLSNGNVGIGTAPGAYRLNVNGGDAYFSGDVSAQSFTDRTPYPENLGVAYGAVMGMKRLPDGEYDPENKGNQLDHSSLTDFVRGKDGNRDLSATVSAQNEVIKDLIRRIEELEKR